MASWGSDLCSNLHASDVQWYVHNLHVPTCQTHQRGNGEPRQWFMLKITCFSCTVRYTKVNKFKSPASQYMSHRSMIPYITCTTQYVSWVHSILCHKIRLTEARFLSHPPRRIETKASSYINIPPLFRKCTCETHHVFTIIMLVRIHALLTVVCTVPILLSWINKNSCLLKRYN